MKLGKKRPFNLLVGWLKMEIEQHTDVTVVISSKHTPHEPALIGRQKYLQVNSPILPPLTNFKRGRQ